MAEPQPLTDEEVKLACKEPSSDTKVCYYQNGSITYQSYIPYPFAFSRTLFFNKQCIASKIQRSLSNFTPMSWECAY